MPDGRRYSEEHWVEVARVWHAGHRDPLVHSVNRLLAEKYDLSTTSVNYWLRQLRLRRLIPRPDFKYGRPWRRPECAWVSPVQPIEIRTLNTLWLHRHVLDAVALCAVDEEAPDLELERREVYRMMRRFGFSHVTSHRHAAADDEPLEWLFHAQEVMR